MVLVVVVVVAVVVVHLSIIYLSICLSVYLLFCETSSVFQLDNVKNETNSARLPQFLKLTNAKTKQFWETSSFFDGDNIKNETILRGETSFKNGKLSAELTASCQFVLRFFHSTCLKCCACHEKVMPSHTKCCTCHAKSSQQPWRSDAPKCNPSQGNQRPGLLTSLMNMSLVLRLPRKMHLCRSSSNVPRHIWTSKSAPNPSVFYTFDFQMCFALQRRATSQLLKVLRRWGALHILTSKCASRFNGVHFFDMSTSKGAPKLRCFVHFDFEMCFAPQQRALFRHLDFQKCSEHRVLCTFWLGHVLRATTACTFSTCQLQEVLRRWGALYILTWEIKCASRHNGVHFFDMSTSKSAPKLRCFVHFDFEICCAPQRRALFRHVTFKKCSEAEVLCTFWLRNVLCTTTACNFSSLIWPDGSAPAALASLLFDAPEPQIFGKTECLVTFLPFRAPRSSFFGDFHLFDLLSSSLLFSDSSHLCFSSVHIVGSLTSKLPSTTFIHNGLASRLPSVSCTNSSPPLPGRTWHCADARQRRLPFSIPGILCGRLRSRCSHGLPPSLCLWFSPDWHRQF